MILSARITDKSYGHKVLHKGIEFDIQDNEKIGLIGRNGTGKSTLFHMLTGEDNDFQGEVVTKRDAIIISSRQEHHGHEAKTVLEYIQGDLPEYQNLTHIIDAYPLSMENSQKKIQMFSDALQRFNDLGYYQIEDEIKQLFEAYQIDPAFMHRQLGSLSGGQKRMVELIKVQRSRGHLALIDEPTNHMDYVAKASFIKWLRAAKEAVFVITHDRDVLNNVDRIIEIRDGMSYAFKGNYDAYLRTNTNQITAQVNSYDLSQKRIVTLQEDIVRFQRMKERARTPGTIRRFKSQEMSARAELQELAATEKPSFWIDQESASDMTGKIANTYDKYKATNIKVRTRKKDSDAEGRVLVQVSDLSLGYGDKPLFEGINFILREGERLRLHGRNGTGKTTIVQAVMAQAQGNKLASHCFAGVVQIPEKLKIGLYEQDINPAFLEMTLATALEHVLREKGLPISAQHAKQLLGDYLFNPAVDGDMQVAKLSGGQKARLQLIAMLVDDPQILILDEPTNHLDLPSIEELENALVQYHGAIMYISHDSFFAKKLGGKTIELG